MTDTATQERFHTLCRDIDEYETLPTADPAADMFMVAPAEEQVVYLDHEMIAALINPWHTAEMP